MDGFDEVRAAALSHDRAGRLAEVNALLLSWNPAFTRGHVGEFAEAFRFKAKLLRHRRDGLALEAALDAASTARSLARLAGTDKTIFALATLEELSCCISALRLDGVHQRLRPWLAHPDPYLAGWAWVLAGQTHLEANDPFKAVAALQNALAEFGRGGDTFRAHTARITLADALDRCGRIADATALLKQGRRFWTGAEPVRRISVAYYLMAARNRRNGGDIDGALRDVATASELLERCTDMSHVAADARALSASCHLEWAQRERAASDARASVVIAETLGSEPPAVRLDPVPSLRGPVRLSGKRAVRGRDLHGSTVSAAREALERATGSPGPTRPALELARRVGDLLEDARTFEARDPGPLVEAAESLAGVPGMERQEAQALFEAGALLADRGDPGPAERLLRRSSVRLRQRSDQRLLLGRVLVTLARLANVKPNDALAWVLEGLAILDSERFKMYGRRFRGNWLEAEIHPAYEQAIALAMRTNQPCLASDLIIRSRTSGITVSNLPDARHLGDGDVPLMPPPQFLYIDGRRSALAGTDTCYFL